jgi:hypothetical protein
MSSSTRLPVPASPRAQRPIDPYRNPVAFQRVLSELHHAENAALEGFRLLADPAMVDGNHVYRRALRVLIRDEAKHIVDIEQMIDLLGVEGGVLPPSPATARFWREWRDGKVFAFPLKQSVAALFCLLSEGIGFVALHSLAQAVTDPALRARLQANVEDEKMHVRLSLHILGQALAEERSSTKELMLYAMTYGLMARKALRAHRATAEAIGLDFDALVSTSMRFLRDLFVEVFERAGRWRTAAFLRRLPRVLWSTKLARLVYYGLYLPEPPLLRRVSYVWRKLQLALQPKALPAPIHARLAPITGTYRIEQGG